MVHVPPGGMVVVTVGLEQLSAIMLNNVDEGGETTALGGNTRSCPESPLFVIVSILSEERKPKTIGLAVVQTLMLEQALTSHC
jgi:hypothetical protein